MYKDSYKTKAARYAAVLLLATSVLVSACGTRTDDDSSVGGQPIFNAAGELISGGDGNEQLVSEVDPLEAITLRVVSNVSSVATGGSDEAIITALATDINNNAVSDASITFSSSDGILRNITQLTNESGEATATLSLPFNFENRDVTVSVNAEDAVDASQVRIIASGSTLDVTGPDALVSGDDAVFQLRLTAGNGEPIALEQLSVSSAAGSVLSATSVLTDVDGFAQVQISAVNAGDTIAFSALGGTVSASHSFEVVADLLRFINIDDGFEIPVGQSENIQVSWMSDGQPVTFQQLRFTTTAGVIAGDSTKTTTVSGSSAVQLSSTSAGPATISVEGVNPGEPKIEVTVEFIATEPANVSISASATRVSVDETSIISALVTDAEGNPVKNTEVTLTSPDLQGGQLSPATAITTSDGIASSTFTAGATPTAVDDIAITATVTSSVVDGAPAIERSLNLTVYRRSLNITMGSTNVVKLLSDGIQYAVPFVVKVTNGSGVPIEDAEVQLSVRPISYRKGRMELVDQSGLNSVEVGEDFTADHWALARNVIECAAEDRNGNRFLDTFGVRTEDINGNSQLDPQDPASLTAVDGVDATLSGDTLHTDANGAGLFDLAYPASNAMWSTLEITASAEALGAEATQIYTLSPPLTVTEVNAVDSVPSNLSSLYGVDVSRAIVQVTGVDGMQFDVFEGCTVDQ